jgi:hypothetical protein
MKKDLTYEEAASFGIEREDEDYHPFSDEYEWWNESVFYDWYDEDGSNAGHCRIGWHPTQQRVWFWLFLYNGEEWVAIEETRLPSSRLQLPKIRYDDGWGLRFSYDVKEPLLSGRFEASGFGRVISGPRTGLVLPVSAALDVRCIGPAHSLGQGSVPGHSDAALSTNRFEQPILVDGRYSIGEDARSIRGRGERDHSWGPRDWNMQWQFMVLNSDATRLQATSVFIPGIDPIHVGYVHREEMSTINEVAFDLQYDDATPTKPFAGRAKFAAEDGFAAEGTVEALTGVEIDIAHCFTPPRRSVYRRALVRFSPDGGEPLLGWIESNRFVD